MRLFRATDWGETTVHPWSCWSESRSSAEAYLDNPGFGGPHIRSLEVADDALVLDITGRRGMVELAEALGYDDAREEAQSWRDSGWAYPWEESREVRRRVAGLLYDWLRYPDDFPEGAITMMALGGAAS